MSELDAMLAAVRADPGDDTVRLVLADWLEEHADAMPEAAARAEFIRVGCELAAKELPIVNSQDHAGMKAKEQSLVTFFAQRSDVDHVKAGQQVRMKCRNWDVFGFIEAIHNYDRAVSGCSVTLRLHHEPEELTGLRRRELDLFTKFGAEWFGFVASLTPPNERERAAGGQFDIIRRGFHSFSVMPWELCSAHLDSILADPWVPGLDEVELTTEPELLDIGWTDHRIYTIRGKSARPKDRETPRELRLRLLELEWPGLVRSWKLPPEPGFRESMRTLAGLMDPGPVLPDQRFIIRGYT